MSTDYAQMSDDELNRLIAERRGLATDVTTYFADGQLWTPIGHGYVKHSACPSWSTDLNAAAELLKDMTDGQLRWEEDTWHSNWSEPNGHGGVCSSDIPARAISEAYAHETDGYPTLAMRAMLAAPAQLDADEEAGIDGLD